MRRFLLFLTVLLTALIVEAVGPKVPHLLWWTPSPSPDVTGYWFYWRATNGIYMDAQRWAISTNAQGYDLNVLGLAKGDYYVAMSATNSYGAESDLSTPDFFWHYANPQKPSNTSVLP